MGAAQRVDQASAIRGFGYAFMFKRTEALRVLARWRTVSATPRERPRDSPKARRGSWIVCAGLSR